MAAGTCVDPGGVCFSSQRPLLDGHRRTFVEDAVLLLLEGLLLILRLTTSERLAEQWGHIAAAHGVMDSWCAGAGFRRAAR